MESCSGQSWPQMISIHALREEGDASPVQPLRMVGNFYPRPPRGGRPSPSSLPSWRGGNFYPRPPRGGRRGPLTCAFDISSQFLSTPSARRATDHRIADLEEKERFLSTPSARRATLTLPQSMRPCQRISIHALREEGDGRKAFLNPLPQHFYPRPPRGGRLAEKLF